MDESQHDSMDVYVRDIPAPKETAATTKLRRRILSTKFCAGVAVVTVYVRGSVSLCTAIAVRVIYTVYHA